MNKQKMTVKTVLVIFNRRVKELAFWHSETTRNSLSPGEWSGDMTDVQRRKQCSFMSRETENLELVVNGPKTMVQDNSENQSTIPDRRA